MRSFGTELSANVQTPKGYRKHTDKVQSAAIVAAREAGTPVKEIATDFNLSDRSVRRVLERWNNDHILGPRARISRPERLTPT